MIPNIEKILKEWSYRVGVIKPNDESHLFQLHRILVNEGWPLGAINEFIDNLNEIAPTAMVSNPNPKGRAKKVQYRYAKQWMDDNPDAATSDDFKKDVGKDDGAPTTTAEQDLDSLTDQRDKIFTGETTPPGTGGSAVMETVGGEYSEDLANGKYENETEESIYNVHYTKSPYYYIWSVVIEKLR